jgi:hypothetical protein
MNLPLTVSKFHCPVTIFIHPDDGTVREYALLTTIREEILDDLIREGDLTCTIRVVFLYLQTEREMIIKIKHENMEASSRILIH